MTTINGKGKFLASIGIPPSLFWGYLGIIIFMMGDGIEQGWLSPYLIEHGFSVQQSASLFTVYGITIAISSWFSGVLVEMFGPRKAMTFGLIFYLLGSVAFIHYGLQNFSLQLMIPAYALRGFGYPLFAYSFLVWISYRSPKEKLGAAVGWFWFVFSGGLFVLGAYFSSWGINAIGHINTLWTSVLWALLGAFFALVLNRDKIEKTATSDKSSGKAAELMKGLLIVKQEPKVLIGGIVRVINTTAVFAFPVFLPMYMQNHGFSTTEWLQIWGSIFTSNIIFNLLFGFIGDKLGWRNTIMWFGGVGCGITTLLLYYVPQFAPGNFALLQALGLIWGALLAGYVPLSALVPSLVKEDKGAAMSILNLGAGLPTFIGPAIVGLLIGYLGETGIVWVLAILYFVGAYLTKFLTMDEK
ncbi:MFS transporter [Brevibacillus sp. B_LB10_24]|uniref:MFS transporter n=1 Tax=Brevibacillus sp. B_LB10_24 TaxID=3380645 RepID=UPI0038BC7CE1